MRCAERIIPLISRHGPGRQDDEAVARVRVPVRTPSNRPDVALDVEVGRSFRLLDGYPWPQEPRRERLVEDVDIVELAQRDRYSHEPGCRRSEDIARVRHNAHGCRTDHEHPRQLSSHIASFDDRLRHEVARTRSPTWDRTIKLQFAARLRSIDLPSNAVNCRHTKGALQSRLRRGNHLRR